jgi:VWFA-related protein
MHPFIRSVTTLGIAAITAALQCHAQPPEDPVFRVDVDMVVLSFTVTDSKGNHVHGLKKSDVSITEDGIPQNVVVFGEGKLNRGAVPVEALAGAKVYVLFDTSNWMYDGFAHAADTVCDFVRKLDSAVSIAVYRFSRNLYRAVTLTRDREQAVSGVRSAVAGDNTALFNTMLLTLRDAARESGRKVIVVFSNGSDNASVVSPDDIATLGEDEGIPIYIVSTKSPSSDVASTEAFRDLTNRTGGRLFWASDWGTQAQALAAVRDDLAGTYTVGYYPAPNPNQGYRRLAVKIAGSSGAKYRVRTRSGYRPHPRKETTAKDPGTR